jgi:hypothetical protein
MSLDENGFLASFDENKRIYKNVELLNGQKIEIYGVIVEFIPK